MGIIPPSTSSVFTNPDHIIKAGQQNVEPNTKAKNTTDCALKALYADNWRELPLPMSEKTLPISELFPLLHIATGHKSTFSGRDCFRIPHIRGADHVLAIEELFAKKGDEVPPRKVLITGSAGIGKSTLCQKIAHDWGSGKLWSDRFNAVYWIPLHLLSAAVSPGGELSKIDNTYRFLARAVSVLLLKDPLATEAILQQIENEPQKVLVIFDGLDETTEKLSRAIEPLLADSKLHVLLTSCPRVTARLHSQMDRIVENVGFSDEQVKTFVYQFFTRKENNTKQHYSAKHFVETVTHDANLSNISHVPLHLQMLCSLWEQEAGESGFDQNPFDLYQNMLEQLFLWEYQRRGEDPAANFIETLSTTSSNCSPPQLQMLLSLWEHGARTRGFGQSTVRLYQNTLEQLFLRQYQRRGKNPAAFSPFEKEVLFCHLGEIGNQSLSAGQRVILHATIEEICQKKKITTEQLLDTGLLKAVGDGDKKQYTFLHPTFQEYLIAYGISHKTLEEQQAFISENCTKSRYWQVMAFLAGITHLLDPTRCKDQVKSFFGWLYDASAGLPIETQLELVLKCLKECADYAVPRGPNEEDLMIPEPVDHSYTGPVPEKLEALLKNDLSIFDRKLSDQRTPFISATWEGNVGGMRWLHHVDPTLHGKADDNGVTPLHIAAQRGPAESVKFLYSLDPTLCDKPNDNGETPMHWAAANGQIEVMRLLNTWDPTLRSKLTTDDETPMHWAAANGQTEAMRLLNTWDRTLRSKSNIDGETPMHWAAANGQTEAMKLLNPWDPTLRSKPNIDDETPFHWAAANGQTEAVKLLNRWDPTLRNKSNIDGETPMHWAAANGQIETIELFNAMDLALRSKPNNYGETPFHLAAANGQIEAMELLTRWDSTLCSKTNNFGETSLYGAALGGHTKAMELLNKWDSWLRSKPDKSGRTPLHMAAHNGHIEAMKLLYSWNQTLCSKIDDLGRTPFHDAAWGGHIEAIKLLHSWDSTLCSTPDNEGITPFLRLVLRGHTEAMEWLLNVDPSLLKNINKQTKRWINERLSTEAKEWILGKDPTFFKESCMII